MSTLSLSFLCYNPRNLQAKTNATAAQAWTIASVNHGNSAAIISKGPTSAVCANGDGGPLDSNQCPTAVAGVADQTAQVRETSVSRRR